MSWMYAHLVFIGIVVALFVVQGAISAFFWSYWTLAFLRLTGAQVAATV